MIHLDTDTAVAYLRGSRDIARRLHSAAPAVRVSSLVLAELLFGATISRRAAENLARVAEFLLIAPVVPFGERCAESAARIKADLRHAGRPVGEIDVLIAATAVAAGATLVTHNRRHFTGIPGLSVEDWLAVEGGTSESVRP
jgi:tRNA(fMet)-specific endonuclease VapC